MDAAEKKGTAPHLTETCISIPWWDAHSFRQIFLVVQLNASHDNTYYQHRGGMVMNHFELYLDESGQFKEQSTKGRPSIVAGYLVNKKCSETWAKNIFTKTKGKNTLFSQINIQYFHAMESRSDAITEFSVCLMEELQNSGATMVVFKNGRGNSIVNSDITYLNVFAEGVLKLIYHLLASYKDDITLNIIYATRLQVEEKEKRGMIQPILDDEYIERIQERIILRMAQITPNERKRIRYTLQWGSARKSALLMLADAINYSFRGGVSALSHAQKDRISALKQLSFKVVEHSGWEAIEAYLASNRWAESVYMWYGEYFDELQAQYTDEFNQLIIDRFRKMGFAGNKVQLEILSNLTKVLIDMRNYETANKFMKRLDQKLFPLLSREGLLSPETEFDLHFFRLTTATHQGDLDEAERQVKICRSKLSQLPATWETLDYYLSYKLREAEHQKNTFDFKGAIDNLNKLEQILTDAVSVVKMIDELGEFGERIKSTTLGKVLGSRVTARCYLSYEFPEQLALARKDSDAAIEQFHRTSDKERQYMTRTMVEYLDSRFEDALVWLGKAYRMDDVTPTKLMEVLRKDKNAAVFGILHYTSLMAAAIKKDNPLGKQMFSAWNAVPPEHIIPDSREYPTNIILWRIATCKAIMQPGAAHTYYKEAISATESEPRNLPHYMAKLAMKAEYEGMLESSKKNKGKRFSSSVMDWQKQLLISNINSIPSIYHINDLLIEMTQAHDISIQKELCLKLTQSIPIL